MAALSASTSPAGTTRPASNWRTGRRCHRRRRRRRAHRAERAQERSALVDLRLVREDRKRRLAECPVDLVLRRVSEAPFGLRSRGSLVRLSRLRRIADDEEPRIRRLPTAAIVSPRPLARADHAQREHRRAVVATRRVACEDRVRDDAQPARVDAELRERLSTVLAVHQAGEALEQTFPQVGLPRRAAREGSWAVKTEGAVHAQDAVVDLRRGEPLVVDDLSRPRPDADEPDSMLRSLQRDPRAGSAEEAVSDGVEDLRARVPVRRRRRRSGIARSAAPPRRPPAPATRRARGRTAAWTTRGRREAVSSAPNVVLGGGRRKPSKSRVSVVERVANG